MRLGADEFRKTYPDECEGTKAYLSENEDLQKELALSKKIYDMQAKYGNTEINLDETASIPLYVSDVYMAMTNYKTNNTCNNPKFGVNNTVFKDYSRIALLFNRALSQNPVHFGKVGIRTENEDGFSLILTNPDKAYKNLSEVLPKVFPLYMPYDNSKQFTTKQVVSRRISRFKDNVGLVLYNVKNRSREM